jgi:hypothetical protein
MVELQRASTALSQAAGFAVPVFSALVFVDPASLTVKAPPGWDGTDLHVVSERGLLPLLTRRRELSDEQLTTVMDAALRAETWHRTPQPSRPGAAPEGDGVDDDEFSVGASSSGRHGHIARGSPLAELEPISLLPANFGVLPLSQPSVTGNVGRQLVICDLCQRPRLGIP